MNISFHAVVYTPNQNVVSIERNTAGGDAGCLVHLSDGVSLIVKETFEQVVEYIAVTIANERSDKEKVGDVK